MLTQVLFLTLLILLTLSPLRICIYIKTKLAGNSSIIKKVNVTKPYLGVINDNDMSSVDYTDVSIKLFRRIDFRFTNNLNQIMNSNGVDISFTATFFKG